MADLAALRTVLADTDPRESVADRLPLLPAVAELLGRRIRRGAVVAIEGELASSSLAMALLAGVSAAGGWCGVVGVPSFGALAAHELGVRLETLALVPRPGAAWAEVVAALIAGTEMVLVAPPAGVPAALARRLAAKARQHRCTVLTLGPAWEGSDVRVTTVGQEWRGLRSGSGRLNSRRVTVTASHRPRVRVDLWLPAQDNTVTAGSGVRPVSPRGAPPEPITSIAAA